MKSEIYRRVLFTLTALATMSMICSESFARGRGGGGRSGGGRSGGARSGASASPRGGSKAQRPSSGPTKLGNKPSQLGGHAAGDGKLSSLSGGLNSGLADKSQLQGLLNNQSGQLSDKLSGQASQLQNGQFQQNAQSKASQHQNGQFQQNAQSKANQFQSGPEPFSPAWYAEHPNAWQATHPHADAAVVATTAAVGAWVGAGYYGEPSSGGSSTTIIYEEAPEEAPTEENSTTVISPAAPLANVAPNQPVAAEEWLPVGIYRLATSRETPPHLMLQLVVDHQGRLRGVYYDSITNTSHNVVGALNTSTQVAQWHLETSQQVSFQASLEDLTQPTGALNVNLASGPQRWLLARIEQ